LRAKVSFLDLAYYIENYIHFLAQLLWLWAWSQCLYDEQVRLQKGVNGSNQGNFYYFLSIEYNSVLG
jgi:hypothetical protein